MQNKLLAGIIVKPQGIKGEIKIKSYIDNPAGFSSLKEIIIQDKLYRIIKARAQGDEAFLLLEGVSDRNEAEAFRGLEVYVDKKLAQPLKAGDYFIDDIIGLEAFVEEELIGKVTDIYPNRGADIFVISGEKSWMVPFVNKAVKIIDLDKKQIVFYKKQFEEIAYAD